MENFERFRAAMQSAGLAYTGPIVADGELHRFKAGKDEHRNSWYVLHQGPPAAGAWGCWKRNLKKSWCDGGDIKTLSDAEQGRVRELWRKADESRKLKEAKRAEAAARTAKWIYNHAEPVERHPYLAKKAIKPYGEIRQNKGSLVIPLRYANNSVTSLQFIGPDGEKRFLPGGKIAGSFFSIPGPSSHPLIVCEGYATGASIHQATGYEAVCAMYCDNLLAVARTVRQQHPAREIIIAADNDTRTPNNPGVTHATDAARAIDGKLAIPQFSNPNGSATDFNDLMNEPEGIQKVQDQINSAQTPTETEAELVARLATLSDFEYDRCREIEADKAGIRVGTLDKIVHEKRGNRAEDASQGKLLVLPEVEPWPEPVNGAETLSRVSEVIRDYVALPKEAADVTALWCAHAHIFDAFLCTPRLNISAPEKGCGKTTLRDVIGLLVPRPLQAENLTSAVLFRVIEKYRPTILVDEYDAWIALNEELRGIVNSGHRRGGGVLRCVGDDQEVHLFQVFAPMALAGIGALPGTILDRSIVIRLVRAKPGEISRRFDGRKTEEESNLCRKLARWCGDNRSRLEGADPDMPSDAVNRVADNWRPLFAIAQIAGGNWPSRVNLSFEKLTQSNDSEEEGIKTVLLRDVRSIFFDSQCTKIKSAELCDALARLEGHPWAEFGKTNRPISQTQLARLLKSFQIFPRNIRLPDGTVPKGYFIDDFRDSFDRFIPEKGVSTRYTATEAENIGDSALLKPLHGSQRSGSENEAKPNRINGCSGVAAQNAEDVLIIEDDEPKTITTNEYNRN